MNSALLFGAGGERVTIVAPFDAAGVRSAGVFPEAMGCDEDINSVLLGVLRRFDRPSIGLDYSADDVTADGLTRGQRLLPNDPPCGTPHAGRLTSAEPPPWRLRGRQGDAPDCRS